MKVDLTLLKRIHESIDAGATGIVGASAKAKGKVLHVEAELIGGAYIDEWENWYCCRRYKRCLRPNGQC